MKVVSVFSLESYILQSKVFELLDVLWFLKNSKLHL